MRCTPKKISIKLSFNAVRIADILVQDEKSDRADCLAILAMPDWMESEMNLGMLIYTFLNGEKVGQDEFGNSYFRGKKGRKSRIGGNREQRWVVYAKKDDPSSVPADWHGWLHHTMIAPPTEQPLPHKQWEQPHLPNKTGTDQAYFPSGHPMAGGERPKATGDYQAWSPEN